MSRLRELPSRKGLILVLSSPSGAGKTSLANALSAHDNNLQISVSLTTRLPRDGEVNGKDYIFVSQDEFKRRKNNGDLLESASVFGNLYGTPRIAVEKMLSSGKDVIFDIDWQGMRQLKTHNLANLVNVLILPPSRKILEKRLRKRALDTEEVMITRMQSAAVELSCWDEYDYTVVNDNFDQSLRVLKSILCAERHRTDLQHGLSDIVFDIQKTLPEA
ncbi:MAG: Guanylate kinase [Hyphomicrobiaceae bacterium hypho_1]